MAHSSEKDLSLKGYKNIRKVFKYYKKHKKYFIGFLSITCINAVASFLTPILLGIVVDSISKGFLEKGIKYSLIMFGVACLLHILRIVNVRFFKQLENRVKMDLKLDTIQSALHIQMKNYDELGNGLFITRLTNDLNIASSTFINISEKLVDFISKIGFLIYVYFLNIYIAFLLTGFVILKYLVYRIRVYYFTILKKQVYKKAEIVNSTIGETIRGVKDLKTLNCEEQILDKIRSEQNEYIKIDNKEWYIGITCYTFADFIQSLFDFMFILLSAFLISNNGLALAIFYTIYIYKGNIMNFAVAMGEMQRYLKEAEVSAYRIFELQNPKIFPVEIFGDKTIEDFQGKIEFKNVNFNYTPETQVLKNINFTIYPNQSISFVGESGCGKSTIINLLSKLYDLNEGEILLDGVNLNELSKDFIRNNISVVTQLPYIFNMSIRDNFKLVKPNCSDKEILTVCKEAGLTSFINKLPYGLDTVVGESGSKASGGQRQRLSIARALITNSKILVFDESTSALDNNSQKTIIETLGKLKSSRTIIIIAHRLTTIENCDRLYFMDNGKIIAEGTHKELFEGNEEYKNLYDKEKAN